MKNKILPFILGFTSIIAQILLLRELIIIFYGNETAYAVILSSWLFWVAMGGFFLSRLVPKIKNINGLLSAYFFSAAIILPVVIFLSRCVKYFMNVGTGEIIGIIPMCVASFLLLGPLTFMLGAIFTLLCYYYSQLSGQDDPELISNVYLWEANGAIAGGLLFSFILVHVFSAMHIAIILTIVNIAAAVSFYKKERLTFRIGLFLLCFILFFLAVGGASKLSEYSREIQWSGAQIVVDEDSIYGNIIVTRNEDQYSLFENGLHSFTTNDDLSAEESVHYALLAHPDPKSILLVGGGVGGGVDEILKYRDAEVDYIELDPKIIEISKKHLPKNAWKSLEDSRVKTFFADARFEINKSVYKYDVVIISLSDPHTALINRYYSQDFFREVYRILKDNGILSLSVSSSENYLSEENRDFLRSINSTLGSIFADVKSIPGDINTFIACKNEEVLSVSSDVFVDRLKARNIKTKFVSENYLPFKLSDDRLDYINNILKEEGRINTDTYPIAYLYDIVLWSTHFNLTFKNVFQKFQQLSFTHYLLIPLFVFFLGLFVKRFKPGFALTLSIITTGFSEIIFQIIVIIAFQVLYGYAYYKIGLILSSFMAGLSFGSIYARRLIMNSPEKIKGFYRCAQCGISVYPLVLPIVFIAFRDVLIMPNLIGIFATVFALLPIISGFLGGMQYPLAVYLLNQKKSKSKNINIASSAGFLYAMDVWGACIGSLVVGLFLIPLLGINNVAYLCALLNFVVLLLLVL